jgi:hypothetical protein
MQAVFSVRSGYFTPVPMEPVTFSDDRGDHCLPTICPVHTTRRQTTWLGSTAQARPLVTPGESPKSNLRVRTAPDLRLNITQTVRTVLSGAFKRKCEAAPTAS